MSPRGQLGRMVILLLAYIGLEGLEYLAGLAPLGMAPWNPTTGLGFAAVLLGGARFLPVMILGELAEGIMRMGVSPDAAAAWIPQAATMAASWGGAALLLRGRIDTNLSRQSDLVLLLAGTAITAVIGAVAHMAVLTAHTGWSLSLPLLSPVLTRSWISDVIGVLAITPAVLVIRTPGGGPTPVRILLEMAALGTLVAAILGFILTVPPADGVRTFYLLFVPSIWAAARFGLKGAVAINLAVQLGAAALLLSQERSLDAVTGAQFRMLTHMVATLVLGAAISQRRRVENTLRLRQDQLARTRLMSTTGEMAAALAHELNQPLAATITFARAAQRLMDRPDADGAKIRAAMDGAVAQAERAGLIMKTLRDFIGHGTPQRHACPPERLITDSVALIEPDCIRAGIKLDLHLPKGLPDVVIDEVQIQQVLANLIRNAMDALDLSGRPYPAITVSIGPGGGGPGGHDMVEVEVSDNGPGMPPEQVDRLFQPFSTTKADGMGLGLSISRTIIESHGGRLWLVANGAGGCGFRFTLPVRE